MSNKNNKSKQYIKHAHSLGYRVLSCGSVKSPLGKRRKLRVNTSGYLRFNIKFNKDTVSIDVHRLAAFQVYGSKIFNDKLVIRHLNDCKTDNRKKNLKLGTHSENLIDSYKNGKRNSK